MKKTKNKTKFLIAFLMILTILATSTLIALPLANARSPPWTYSTYSYVAPAPPLVGLSQPILIIYWLNAVPPTAAGAIGDRWTVYIDVIKPDATNDTFGPLTSDSVGGGYISYTPTSVGTYTCVVRFPGQTITGLPGNAAHVAVGDIYTASTSKPASFTVQEEKIQSYIETPLPTDYWTRPVYDANRGWGNAVMGQWLGQPWDTTLSRTVGVQNQAAVLSPHILWTRPAWTGGIMGTFDDTAFYNGIAYEGFSSPLVCLNGMGYYSVNNPPRQGWYCINLYNGETKYFENNTNGQYTIPAMGQMLNYETPNQHGGFSYLWRTSGVTLPSGNTSGTGTTNWEMLDGFTGNAILKIANVSTSGTQFRDSMGSICYLNFVNLGTAEAPNYYMQIWNTTQAIWWQPRFGISPPATLYNGTTNVPLTSTSNDYWFWRPGSATVSQAAATGYGTIYDGRNGYSMNISVASIFGPRNSVINQTGSIQWIKPDEFVIVGASGRNDARGTVQGFLTSYSLKSPWGQKLWSTTFTPPAATDAYPNSTYSGGITFGGVNPISNIFWFTESVTGKQWIYDITTGQQIWTDTIENAWSYYGSPLAVHGGKAYTTGPGGPNAETAFGIINCFDAATGQFLWNFTAPRIGYLEEEGSVYTPLELQFFLDDPYTGHTYLYLHGSTGWAGQTTPIRRDSAIICVDCDTGQMVWRLEAYPGPSGACKLVINDGRLVYLDHHDDNIYSLGKGPSATTVSAPQTNPLLGSSVTIIGTVTDQTDSGRINVAGSKDFTLKGTPAISDASMEAWMEYMFQQRPKPANATGVLVQLNAVDPNGNYIHIGNVTSDLTGAYGYNWTPEVPGTYQIIAKFEGSASYGSSTAQTYMTVSEALPTTAPTAAPQADTVTQADLITYMIVGVVAIIIAIAIVGVLLLRKHP